MPRSTAKSKSRPSPRRWRLAREAGVGIYPELKHPSFLREQGLDPVPAFVAAVRAGGGQSAADSDVRAML